MVLRADYTGIFADDGLVLRNGLALANEPVNLINSVLIAVKLAFPNVILFLFCVLSSVMTLAAEDAIRGRTGTGRDSGNAMA